MALHTGGLVYSLPRWRATRWLADAGRDVPEDIRVALIGSLYGTLPIFAGGVINTILVALVCAARVQEPLFFAWLGLEISICLVRLSVVIHANRAARQGRRTYTDHYMALGLFWAASVGYGTFISIASGDWVVATLACLSAAAMVGGICFRNFGAPRLACAMILLSLGPCCLGAALAGEPILLLSLFQIPFYLVSMGMASWKLNQLLVSTIKAERDNAYRARHDALTGLYNRAGLAGAVERKWPDAGGPTQRLALLFLDLDGFKGINDSFGHAAGDHLLELVAERLKGTLASGDVAARVGGDEFVILTDALDALGVLRLAQRLISEVAGQPFRLEDGSLVDVGVSVGIAFAPEHGEDFAALLAAADAALYQAKSKGKSRCAIARRPRQPEPARARRRSGRSRLGSARSAAA
jgi:diguanylate cyclase (GGDEF)-like protein